MSDDKIEIENVNTPGRTERVDRTKYIAMGDAFIAVLPNAAPELTIADAKEALLPRLPDDLFPEDGGMVDESSATRPRSKGRD